MDESGIVLLRGKSQIRSGVFLRGGNWNNGSNAGAFTLNLNNDTGSQNNNIGFRCASDELTKCDLVCQMSDMRSRMHTPDLYDHKVFSVSCPSVGENIIPVSPRLVRNSGMRRGESGLSISEYV